MVRSLTCSLLLLIATSASAGVKMCNVCDDVRFKGDKGVLLLVCPINKTQGKVVLRIKGLCTNNPPLRIWYKGKRLDEAALTCGNVPNPWLQGIPPPTQYFDFKGGFHATERC
jgi:hypothetical protein